MNIFNTKKVRTEWERKIEESYNQGKNDAIDEALSSIDKSKEDKEQWNELSEKELMVEIMNTLSLYNKRLDHMNDKISYISDYKLMFKEINERIKELNKCEQSLCDNIEKSKEQVVTFEKNAKQIITKAEKIDDTLIKIVEVKNKVENIISDFKNVIPNLKDACIQINDIASNMNNILEQYSDSPMTVLNKLKVSVKNIQDSIDDVQVEFDSLNKKIGISLEECEDNSLYSKLDDMEFKINSALDEYSYSSLYSKLNDMEFKLDDIENKLDETSTNY